MIIELIQNIQRDVDSGYLEPLKAYAMINDIEKEIKEIKYSLYDRALDEAHQNEKTFESYGYRFEVRNGRKSYDFKDIPDWQEANKFVKELEQKYKDAAASYERGRAIIDEDTGEQIPCAKVTYAKDSIIIRKLNG